MAVRLNLHDLEFVLRQIKIAEAHTAGTPLTDLLSQPHLPYGLRTVDGTYNNVIPGRELWGAADQTMPRMFDPYWRNENDGDAFDPDGAFGPAPAVVNTDYNSAQSVADADPRIISNLIVDQTPDNPAAVMAALRIAEYSGNMTNAVTAIRNGYQQLKALDEESPEYAAARANYEELLRDTYGVELQGNSLIIPNVAPDEGLSAPFNGWMTFFGQFFDHGLDLVSKGGAGTIYIPLQPDDPLYVEGGHTNFMVLTRATQFDVGPGEDGVMGTGDDAREAINVTTPFVDQNQTYTSHPSHQVFLREYKMVFDPELGHEAPLATGRMLDGERGLPTWADVKRQARELLGIELTDKDVFNIPLVRTDLYGEFIRGPDGFPQVITNIGPDGIPNTDDDVTASGTPDNPLTLRNFADPVEAGDVAPVRTSHSFLDDIAHNAVPVISADGVLVTDNVIIGDVDPAGNAVQFDPLTGANLEYDNELLDRHFITGDGRGNENIGLTAVHHVFHSEHNRQVGEIQQEILLSKDPEFVREWLRVDLTEAQEAALAAASDAAALSALADELGWDGERLFQAARFATEMQYQHLVFEEFGRKVQPLIDPFVFNTITDIDPAIFAEFAHVVYRFGHSMLTENVARMFLDESGQPIRYDAEGNPVALNPDELESWSDDIGLIEAFLNPIEFDKDGALTHEQAAGAIFRGMNRVRGNEIDEFVTEALRNNLLGLPLDLAAVNIARGRDAGMPTLNQARAQLFEASNSSFLEPYRSWSDFAANLKNPTSVVNFIAAYGDHELITSQTTVAGKRDAAWTIVTGTSAGGLDVPADRQDFLNALGAYAGGTLGGLNTVDLWIGGLAEKQMPFGGMLGSTFNAVFEAQLEMLQDLDRFYYLTRTQGLNLLNELENNSFSKLVAANTDMTAEDGGLNFPAGVDSFAKHDFILNVDPDRQVEPDPEDEDGVLTPIGLAKVMRDDPGTPGQDANYLRFIGGEHVAIGGTVDADTIIADYGDDAIWGGEGDDRIEAGAGVDLVVGGSGNDTITDSGDTGDFLKGEDGDDVIANSNGLDVVMGGDGKDVILIGVDATEVFAGEGDDFILGGADADFILGNEGDDWMEGGDGFDVLNGDNSELFFNSTIIGHDVLLAGENENDFDAESGDDIMVQGESVMRNEGMLGFDWAIHKGNRIAADSDMRIPIFTNVADDILRDRFDQTEALSGWIHNDVLRGDDRGSREEIEVELDLTGHELTQAGVDRIDGLRELLGESITAAPVGENVDLESIVAWAKGNILLGGDGSDTFEGRGGDDFIHGDAWLNVRISVRAPDGSGELFSVDSLKQVVTVDGQSKPLSQFLLSGQIKPGQLEIVREILYDEDPRSDTDTAIFAGNRDWYEITHVGDRTYVARREMEEVDPQIDEGVDTLVGIERIQFSDQTYTIRETGNVDPTGRLIITSVPGVEDSGLPARENRPLRVSAENVRDANNPNGMVSNITYRWQIERNDGTGDYIDIPGAAGDTFTPTDEHTGLRIRVLGRFVDGGGVTEVVSSAPTDVVLGVNDEPQGAIAISDITPTEDRPVTVTIAFEDLDGLTDAFEESLIVYQWQHSATGAVSESDPDQGWTNIPAEAGGNARTLVPGAEHVGQYLRMVVIYTDDLGFEHRVDSAVTGLVGAHIVSDAAVITGQTVGDDWIEGGANANSISGGDGGDLISGGAGSDTIQGGNGADTLAGNDGSDSIDGGAGDDTIVYSASDDSDIIDGGAGTDTLRITAAVNGPNDLVTVALGADGLLTGLNGALVSGVETIEMNLGGGVDTLNYNGTALNLTVDLLTGAASGFSFISGVENLIGGTGNDHFSGNSFDNHFVGAAGDDTLRGGYGADSLEGGAGADRLYGEEGGDTLVGGLGDDRIDGGVGTDTASYAGAAAGVTVNLASQEVQDTVGDGLDMLVSIENLIGSAFGDVLSGNTAANVLDGGAGSDSMAGGAGDDTYVVDNAGDVVTEAADGGEDTVRSSIDIALAENVENLILTGAASSGAGNASDNQLTGNAGNNTLNGGAGVDTVVLTEGVEAYDFALSGGNLTVASAAGGVDTLIGIEQVDLGGIYNLIVGTNASNPALTGTGGNDLLLGLNQADTLIAGAGDDILIGGLAADVMRGGVGDDTYIVNQAADLVDELTDGGGVDTVLSTVNVNLNTAARVIGDVENVTLLGAGDLQAIGNGLANLITGNAGANLLRGNAGADTLDGAAGADSLFGGAADDELAGGDGDDNLSGEAGVDTAYFASGAANYSFAVGAGGVTTVTDLVGAGGTDSLSGIERLRFADGEALSILVGTAADDGAMLATQASIIFGLDGADNIRGSDGDDIIIGGAGDDTLFGGDFAEGDNLTDGATDDDTFIWRVGDGSDIINGGLEGARGDRFEIVGDDSTETYRIYTFEEAEARIGFAGDDEAEIVVTRQVSGGEEVVIASLTDIEEIAINNANVSGGGESEGDVFEIYGNFDNTNLRPNTITLEGTNGADIVNISGLTSSHRFVFKSNGGDDIIVGARRPQDVIELPGGADPNSYTTTTDERGVTILTNGEQTITYALTDPRGATPGGGEPGGGDPPAPPQTVIAANGRETHVGSAGADTFVFGSESAAGNNNLRDVITDFVSGQDRIDLSGIDASQVGRDDRDDNDAFGSVVAASNFSGPAQIRYHVETVGGVTYTIVSGNVDIDNSPEFQIGIVGVHQLTAADFIL